MYLYLNLNLQYSFKRYKGNQNLEPNSLYCTARFANFKGFGVFLFLQSFEWGGVITRHNATHSPSLARKLRMTL